MFANTQMMGTDMAFPDVCLTPAPPAPSPVPIPYPNIGLGPTKIPVPVTVLFMACPSHNLATVAPLTNGDNAGVSMGVASGTVMGPAKNMTASFTILLKGAPATKMTSMSQQNSTDSVGATIVPSQPKVILLAP